MGVAENNISKQIQAAASAYGGRLFRNNLGTAIYGGIPVQYGIANPGGSDLIGWTKDGRFHAVEVKTAKGKIKPSQQNFIDQVNKVGGVAFICRDVEEYHSQIAAHY